MLEGLISGYIDKISSSSSSKELDEIKVSLLGKNGLISSEMKKISGLSEEDKKSFGRRINEIKSTLLETIDQKYQSIKADESKGKLLSEKIDISLPGRFHKVGSIHPISQAIQELLEIFVRLGFEMKDGPNIEDDWHNFGALNFPEDHPARQMHDTFYLADSKLLRTHTSTVQIRAMSAGKPPFRFVSCGRVYRSDSDATHTPMFHQIEVLMIDKGVHMGHLKYTINEFIAKYFEKDDIEIRLRPSFFPFTEPSAEVDIKMRDSDKWLEVLGCGMVHPNVLKNMGIDQDYRGFALGMGVERFAMLKYGIKDLRQMFDGDKRWIDHYNFSAFDIPSFIGGLTR